MLVLRILAFWLLVSLPVALLVAELTWSALDRREARRRG